jgi:hypothetical protein
VIRDKDGQAFVPGFLDAVARGPLQTEGELPGGGGLFRPASVAGHEAQRDLFAAPTAPPAPWRSCDEATADPRPRCACGRPRRTRPYNQRREIGAPAYFPTCDACAKRRE